MGDQARSLHCPADVAALVPEALAREVEFFPLEHSGGVITVAVAVPLSDEARDKLRFVLDQEIREVLHPAEVIRRSLDGLYGEWVGGEESIYYWREWRNVLDDGTIVMKARGYDQFGAHWTGWAEITPDGPDFGLWTWILAREDRFDKIISGKDLEAIREEYRREA
jgi:Type II secretion system (T2SS), protein E, N-terminal domain